MTPDLQQPDLQQPDRAAMAIAEPIPLAVDIKTAAKMLGMSQSTVWREVKAGRLKVKRTQGRVLFPVKWLNEWLEA